MDVVSEEAKKRDEEEGGKGNKVVEEDIVLELDPILQEEHFLKAVKALSDKALEGMPLFTGKMDLDVVLDWIEGVENHFVCEG